jgi:hypothetical protein
MKILHSSWNNFKEQSTKNKNKITKKQIHKKWYEIFEIIGNRTYYLYTNDKYMYDSEIKRLKKIETLI